MSYSKKIREANHKPQDGSPPLTVVEFSLTDKKREEIKADLDEQLRSGGLYSSNVQAIVEKHLPIEILTELRELAGQKGIKKVFVMHNLPEMDDIDASSYARMGDKDKLKRGYISQMIQGLALSANMRSTEPPFALLRKAEDDYFAGAGAHKHLHPVNALGSVLSTGAPTRFIDMDTLLEEAKRSTSLSSIRMRGYLDMPGFELGNLNEAKPDWREHQEFELNANSAGADKWEKLLEKHSLEVALNKGSLVFWSNDGAIFHEARPAPASDKTGEDYVRIAVGGNFARPGMER